MLLLAILTLRPTLTSMSVTTNYFVDRLRSAEQASFAVPELGLASELAQTLSDEILAKGAMLNFGSDRVSFEQTLDVLGVDAMLARDGPMAICQAVTHSPGYTSYIAKSIEALAKLPVVEAIDVLQADRWKGKAGYLTLRDVDTTVDTTTSYLLLCNRKRGTEEPEVDLTLPGIMVGVSYRYAPELTAEEYFRTTRLADVLDEANKEWQPNPVGQLALKMVETGEELVMPGRSYFLGIGDLARGPFVMPISISSVHHEYTFELQAGKFKEVDPWD